MKTMLIWWIVLFQVKYEIRLLAVLSLSNYVLIYPAILDESTPLFNIMILFLLLILLMGLFLSIFYLASTKNHEDPFIKSYKHMWGFLSELTDKILVVPVVGLTIGNISCEYKNN
jgi:hypothetical protein